MNEANQQAFRILASTIGAPRLQDRHEPGRSRIRSNGGEGEHSATIRILLSVHEVASKRIPPAGVGERALLERSLTWVHTPVCFSRRRMLSFRQWKKRYDVRLLIS